MLNPKLSETFYEDIKIIVNAGKPIIVHGGGPQINQNLELKFEHKIYKGMRITDEKILKIVQMVLTGFINKNITTSLCERIFLLWVFLV